VKTKQRNFVTKNLWLLHVAVFTGCVLLVSCANPLKGKPPYWYNGYVYGTRAHDLFSEGMVSAALGFYRKAIIQAQTHDIPEQVALYRFNIGRCFLELDKVDSAVAYFTKSYTDYILFGNAKAANQAAGYAALAFVAATQADSAFLWYKKGYGDPQTPEDKAFWLMIHGKISWLRDHSKEAITYFDEAYTWYTKKKSYHGAAQMSLLRARAYLYFGDSEEAKKQIQDALALGDKTNLRFDRFRLLLCAATVYTCANEMPKAEWYYNRAVQCIPDGIPLPVKEQVLTCTTKE
jgi:tetratricopeptide (TPR) repeat protein